MTARHKLNAVYFGGATIVGAILGIWTGSFVIFLAATGIIIALAAYEGSIRLT